MDLSTAARWIMAVGAALLALGGLLWLAARAGVPLGNLPGDLRWQGGGLTCFVPLASAIVLSLLLTLLLNLVIRLFNR